MLCLTMTLSKKLYFDDDMQLKVIKVKGNEVTFSLLAPTSVKILDKKPERQITKKKISVNR